MNPLIYAILGAGIVLAAVFGAVLLLVVWQLKQSVDKSVEVLDRSSSVFGQLLSNRDIAEGLKAFPQLVVQTAGLIQQLQAVQNVIGIFNRFVFKDQNAAGAPEEAARPEEGAYFQGLTDEAAALEQAVRIVRAAGFGISPPAEEKEAPAKDVAVVVEADEQNQ